jgi:hypothetical protein
VSYAGYGGNIGQTTLKGTESSTLDVINDGTLLKAGNDLNVKANNVSVVSGELTSGQNTTLDATNDITLATAQDIHQTSTSQISGKTTTVGASYGTTFGAGGDSKNSANVNIGGSLPICLSQAFNR